MKICFLWIKTLSQTFYSRWTLHWTMIHLILQWDITMGYCNGRSEIKNHSIWMIIMFSNINLVLINWITEYWLQSTQVVLFPSTTNSIDDGVQYSRFEPLALNIEPRISPSPSCVYSISFDIHPQSDTKDTPIPEIIIRRSTKIKCVSMMKKYYT